MRRISLIVAALLITTSAAGAETVPLPRPRPSITRSLGVNGHATTPVVEPSEATASEPAEPSACQLRLEGRAIFRALPPLIGPGECGATDVVRLDAVVMPNNERVVLAPPPTLRCSMADAITEWVREEVGAAASALGSPLKSIENYDSYDCRGRNRIVGAKLSEHGRANALDIRSVKLANGRSFQLTEPSVSRAFRERMRQTACTRFKTVLGPGSDGYHEEHIHVDLAERSHGFAMCQWDIREPAPAGVAADVPLPRPRPFIAGNFDAGRRARPH